MKGFYFDTLGPSRTGELAQDIILSSVNKHNNRLNLMVAKKLQVSPLSLVGHHVTLVTGTKDRNQNERTSLILENIDQASTSIDDFSNMLESKIWGVNNDHLRLKLLLVRLDGERQALQLAKANPIDNALKIKQAHQALNRGYLEIIRRLSVALGLFTFTLMGAAFGVSISRNSSNRGVLYVVLLGAMFLIAFFGAKEADHAIVLASTLYLLPHVIIIAASIWMLNRINHGIE